MSAAPEQSGLARGNSEPRGTKTRQLLQETKKLLVELEKSLEEDDSRCGVAATWQPQLT